MFKRAVAAVLGCLSLCATVVAQKPATLEQGNVETFTVDELRSTGAVDVDPALTLYRPDLFSRSNGSILIHNMPTLMLLDGRPVARAIPLRGMGVTTFDLIPLAFLSAVQTQKVNGSPVYGTDVSGGVVDLRLNRNYAGGEAGVFYGRSTGKYGLEDFQSYIIGTVGNDKFQITAGASYEELSARIPRRGR